MSFLWPWALLSLLALPLLVWGYLRGLPRPARTAALHPDLALLAQASRRPRPLRRHLPALLYLGALTLALVALGLVALAASVYLVYVLEILKFRHRRAGQLRTRDPATTEHEIDEKVRREVETGEFERVG